MSQMSSSKFECWAINDGVVPQFLKVTEYQMIKLLDYFDKNNRSISIYCGLVIPHGDIDLGHHWLR